MRRSSIVVGDYSCLDLIVRSYRNSVLVARLYEPIRSAMTQFVFCLRLAESGDAWVGYGCYRYRSHLSGAREVKKAIWLRIHIA